MLVDFREFVQSSLNPPLLVTFLKTSGAGLLDMAQGTDNTSTDHRWCPQTLSQPKPSHCVIALLYFHSEKYSLAETDV